MSKKINIIIYPILKSTSIEWLPLRKIHKDALPEGYELTIRDDWNNSEEPFNIHRGYLEIVTNEAREEFKTIITEAINDNSESIVLLSNLFILLERTYPNIKDDDSEEDSFTKVFVSVCKPELLEEIYFTLIASLNTEYYKHINVFNAKPDKASDWTNLLRRSNSFHTFSDPLLHLIYLIKTSHNRTLPYKYVKPMAPLLRATIFGFNGYDLEISDLDSQYIFSLENEIAFVTSVLIDDIRPDKIVPAWLTSTLIENILNSWCSSGRYLLQAIYGLHSRHAYSDMWITISNLVYDNLNSKIKSEDISLTEKFEFPSDVIAVSAMLFDKKFEIHTLHPNQKNAILSLFLNQLNGFFDEFEKSFINDSYYEPFDLYYAGDAKFQNMLAFVLLCILDSSDRDIKHFKAICYKIVPCFYGTYKSKKFAENYCEFLILVLSSAFRLTGLDIESNTTIGNYLDVINNTVLFSYAHKAEQNDFIWDIEGQNVDYQFNASLVVLNAQLKEVSTFNNFKAFFNEFNNSKIAVWPFEK